MSEYPKIHGAAQLRYELSSIIKRYVQHLDWDAPTELTSVKIEATGQGITLHYSESLNAPPMLEVSIGEWPPHD
jgi:hypothetical protein